MELWPIEFNNCSCKNMLDIFLCCSVSQRTIFTLTSLKKVLELNLVVVWAQKQNAKSCRIFENYIPDAAHFYTISLRDKSLLK